MKLPSVLFGRFDVTAIAKIISQIFLVPVFA